MGGIAFVSLSVSIMFGSINISSINISNRKLICRSVEFNGLINACDYKNRIFVSHNYDNVVKVEKINVSGMVGARGLVY